MHKGMAASGLGGVDFARRQTQKTPDMPAGLDHRAFTASAAMVARIAPRHRQPANARIGYRQAAGDPPGNPKWRCSSSITMRPAAIPSSTPHSAAMRFKLFASA